MMKQKREIRKKGISPVIATVLLISIVVVIALLIFIWASNFFGEVGKKLGKSAEQVCTEINLKAEIIENQLSVINNGNVPIYSLNVYKTLAGSIEVQKIEGINLMQGSIENRDIGTEYEKVEIMPIILVQVKNNNEAYSCEKNKIEVLLEE